MHTNTNKFLYEIIFIVIDGIIIIRNVPPIHTQYNLHYKRALGDGVSYQIKCTLRKKNVFLK